MLMEKNGIRISVSVQLKNELFKGWNVVHKA